MGCDIHAIIEVKTSAKFRYSGPYWENAGDPMIPRNYEVFTALAGVRSYDNNQPIIALPRGIPDADDHVSEVMQSYIDDWRPDGHSHSWVTLREMMAYDTSVFAEGTDSPFTWQNAIQRMQRAADEVDGNFDLVRLVFFFDN